MKIEYHQKPFTGQRRIKISSDDIFSQTGVRINKINRSDALIEIETDTDFDLDIEGFEKRYGDEVKKGSG